MEAQPISGRSGLRRPSAHCLHCTGLFRQMAEGKQVRSLLDQGYRGEMECTATKIFAVFAGTCISEGESEMLERGNFK